MKKKAITLMGLKIILMFFVLAFFCEIIALDRQLSYRWTTDFDKARLMSKTYQKPLVLIFTGSDWSEGSKKIIDQIKDESFQSIVKNECIVTLIDFPEVSSLNKENLETNFFLRKNYDVSTFPTLVLLSKDLEIITKLGFIHQNPQELARGLIKRLKEYEKLRLFLTSSDQDQTIDRIRCYYDKVKELGFDSLRWPYIELGLVKEKGLYFHLEKYSYEVGRGIHDEKLKGEIVQRDSLNHQNAFLQLALCDFQQLAKQSSKDLDKAVEFLIEYAQAHHVKEGSSFWKLHQLIAHHLKEKGQWDRALDHLQLSLKIAPKEYEKEIQGKIKSLARIKVSKSVQ